VAVTARTVNIAEVIDEAAIGRTQILVLMTCALVAILDGFDLQAIAFTGPVIAQQWKIEATALGVLFSAALAGMTCGAALTGLLGDYYGRKVAIGLSVAVFGSFTLATALADSYNQLLVFRFLTGVGVGGAIPSITTLTAEYAPARLRVKLIALMSIGIPLGGVFGGLLAAQLIPDWGWESVFYVGGVLPLLLLVVVAKLLPESLHVLVAKGGEDDHRTIAQLLNHIHPSGHYTPHDTFLAPETPTQGSKIGQLFGDGLARNTLLLWLAFFINLFALYFLMTWLPALLLKSGFVISKAINVSVLFGLGGAIGALLLAQLMTRYGSRQMLVVFFALAAFLCAVVVRLVGSSPVSLMGLIFLSGFLTLSAQIGMNTLAAALYPAGIRGTGVGWALGLGRIGAVSGPVIGGILASWQLAIQDYFLLFGLVLAIAAIAVALIQFDDRPVPQPRSGPELR
jgi:AAHS family 4-hydroxybenzoate transporter-like MFS transporter